MSTEVTTTNAIPEGKDLKVTFAPSTLSALRGEVGPDMSLRDYIILDITEDAKFAPFKNEIGAIVEQVGGDTIIFRISEVSNNDLRSNLRTALAPLVEHGDEISKAELIDAEASKSTAASHLATYKWWYLGGATAVAAAAIVIMRKKD